jgi:transcriptional regulator with XRE-family HTH domain
MHLVSYGPKIGLKSFYQKQSALTRPDSLPHIFYKLRQNHNLTKRALAEKFSVSEDYVSKVERGSVFPSLDFCLKCADLFEANPGWVKMKWAREAVERFSERIKRRLGLEN